MKKIVLKQSNRTTVCLAALLALCVALQTPAQTLARPGWVGSGMSAQSWFRHAVLYRIDVRCFAHSADAPETAPGTLKGITERLDYIRDLGIDAILLGPLTPDLIARVASKVPVDPALGTIEDFDELSLQASKRSIRILLTLRDPDAGLVRYWLTRGVAGFYVPGPVAAPALQPIRKLLPTFVGQRILITDVDLSGGGAAAKSLANELQLDSAIAKLPAQPSTESAAQLRRALELSQTLQHSGTPMLATDAADVTPSVSRFAASGRGADAAKLLGAILLLNRSVPVLYAGQELGLALPAGTAVTIPWGNAPAAEPEPAVEATLPAPQPPPVQATVPFIPSERYVPYVAPVKPAKPAKPTPPDAASAAGQELNPNSNLSFYRQLIQMHRGRPAVRDGDEVFLNHDDANALVFVRSPFMPSLATPPLVVICNLSDKQLRLSLKRELIGLHLRGSFLRSVLHSDSESVSMNVDPVSVPPFGVYIGELRY